MRKRTSAVLVCLASLVALQEISAQPESAATALASSRSVPDTAWQRLTKPPAFAYRNLREGVKPQKPAKVYKPSTFELFIAAFIRFFGTTLGKIILWAVVIGILGYGVWMALSGSGRFGASRGKKVAAEEDPTEEDLHGTAWMRLMEEALAAGDTRLAVRYGYLHVLKALTDAGRIGYRPGKTNADYAAELAGGAHLTDFRALSRTYEYTWYGSYPTSAGALSDFRTRLTSVTAAS